MITVDYGGGGGGGGGVADDLINVFNSTISNLKFTQFHSDSGCETARYQTIFRLATTYELLILQLFLIIILSIISSFK